MHSKVMAELCPIYRPSCGFGDGGWRVYSLCQVVSGWHGGGHHDLHLPLTAGHRVAELLRCPPPCRGPQPCTQYFVKHLQKASASGIFQP